MVPECSKLAYGQLRSISFSKPKNFYFSAIFENFMVMDANFVITKKLISACWACSHRGKNGLIDQKIEIFKVHDIDTIIQQREKTHQTHLSSAVKTFYDHMWRLWDSGKISKFCTSFTLLVAFSAENATRRVNEQNFEICHYLIDVACDHKMFLQPN